MSKKRHHLAIQLEKEKQERLDNGPIELTVDQLWEYSGKIEEFPKEYVVYEEAMIRKVKAIRKLKAVKIEKPTRKEYYKEYWRKYKIKALKKLENGKKNTG
tara:strand:+ start:82 stop:384 length:303 start_codon:yes stop_codon:yes gene_type:complete